MRALIICLFISAMASANQAQDRFASREVEDVKKVINELFEGYREGDSTRVAKIFDNQA